MLAGSLGLRGWLGHTAVGQVPRALAAGSPHARWCGVLGSQVLQVAWYRCRATLRRRWGGYLGLVLLIGLMGGVALGSAAAARRTESSFSVFLASTNPSDLSVQYASNYYAGLPPFARTAATCPRSAGCGRRGAYRRPLGPGRCANGGEPRLWPRGSYRWQRQRPDFNQDRVTVIRGRMTDPRRPDQVVMNAQAARELGLHVGAVVPLGFYTNAQASSPGYGTPRVRPVVRIEARIVGLVEFSNAVVQDDIDRPQGYLLLTPALTRVLLAARTSGGITQYGLQLDYGARDLAVVEREIDSQLGNGGQAQFHVASINAAQAQSAIEPDWIALAAFAMIAGLATLIIAAQAIARQVRAGSNDMRVLRALGASPAMAAADCLLGILGAVMTGSLLAAGVAVALSPVAPIGPVRPVYQSPGVAFDWTILGFGFLALAGCLAAVAAALAFRAASQHGTGPATLTVARNSGAGRLAARSGLPAPAVAGVHFAFDPGKAAPRYRPVRPSPGPCLPW